MTTTTRVINDNTEKYLDLLRDALTGALFEDGDQIIGLNTTCRHHWSKRMAHRACRVLRKAGFEIIRKRPYSYSARENGLDWPARAESMIGLRRMNNLRSCVEQVLLDEVPGDLIETGVWRGGAVIYMRAILEAYGDRSRRVFVADSFQGLPKPDPKQYPDDYGDQLHQEDALCVSLEQVQSNFRRYGFLDDRVHFLPGWFRDTLRSAPIKSLSVLRLDGDMYESTMDALDALYPKLSVGGFCIVDDYGPLVGCQRAVTDYRKLHRIEEEIAMIDGAGAFWRKQG